MSGVLLLAALVFFSFIAYKLISRKMALKGHEVSSEEALKHFANKGYILDVRTPEEYKEGHIPGVHLLPLGELGRRFKEIPQDREVYIICRSGSRSAEATVWLLKRGYDKVYNISGGMLRWKGQVEK